MTSVKLQGRIQDSSWRAVAGGEGVVEERRVATNLLFCEIFQKHSMEANNIWSEG